MCIGSGYTYSISDWDILCIREKGILFKEAKFIETLASADTVIFDKTGTVTDGYLKVIGSPDIDSRYVDILYSLTSSSNHPVSLAVKRYLEENYPNLKLLELDGITQIDGKGMEARYGSMSLLGGSDRLLQSRGLTFNSSGRYTNYIFAVDDEVIGSFNLEDGIRDGCKGVDLSNPGRGINLEVIKAYRED